MHFALETAKGNATAVWQEYAGSKLGKMQEEMPRYHIYGARYSLGKGWGEAMAIEQGKSSAEFPKVAIDASGNATLVWWKRVASSYFLVARRYEDGVGWHAAVESR